MADDKFQRFGKYLILDHLVDGGMAKICRARFLGEQANKIVAIKMVQAQYSKDPSFVQMFEDELKVTFDLLHPNIAQVYDYGLVDEQLYSAMEYIDGANLKQFLDRLKSKKFVFPVEISTYIISQVSQALHYAHNFQDKLTGTSFNIIHRDISPHNIMLTYDGAVKVIDFGIAKADSNAESTQAGTIKGKLSYLAPEYLDGLELDHRYDQFAVGISLWEMLCSRKLFTAKNDLAVLKQIQACKIPKPSSINPNVPAELDEIVLKSLSKDRNKRFENMDQLNRALVRFLYSNYPEFNATDLGYFAKQLFTEEIAADRKKFVEFGKIDIRQHLDDIARNDNGGGSQASEAVDGSFVGEAARTGKIELDLGDFSQSNQEVSDMGLEVSKTASKAALPINKTTTRRIKRPSSNASARTTTEKQSGSTTTRQERNTSSRTKTRRVERSGTTRARTKVAGKNVSKKSKKGGTNLIPTIAVASFLVFILTQNKMIAKKTGINILCNFGIQCGANATRNPADSGVVTDPVVTKKRNIGKIDFINFDFDMKVFINGKEVEMQGISYELPFGRQYNVVIKKEGYKKWDYPELVEFTEDKPFATVRIPELESVKMGYISTSRNFTSGSVIVYEVDGEKIEKSLPLNDERVPAGTYDAVIANKLLQTERKVRFTVKENKKEIIK